MLVQRPRKKNTASTNVKTTKYMYTDKRDICIEIIILTYRDELEIGGRMHLHCHTTVWPSSMYSVGPMEGTPSNINSRTSLLLDS